MSVLENKLCLSRGRTLNSRLSSQILNLMLVAFVLLHLVKIRCSKHIICETGTTVEHTSHTDTQCFTVFSKPLGKDGPFRLNVTMRLGRNPALLNKSTFPSPFYKESLFEESFIKATQMQLKDRHIIPSSFKTHQVEGLTNISSASHWPTSVGIFGLLHQPRD